MSAHTLILDGVTKRYGNAAAVDNISLTIERGRFFGLLGPSGSGKTTVLMIIAGFTDPTSGAVRLDGRDITQLPPERRNFGMVFQGYALFPNRTVAENVAFPLSVRRRPRAEIETRVAAALDLVRLNDLQDRLPRQLSGGQQQRVALARAIVFEPDILLLDEPLSALDKKLRAGLQWELRELHQRIGTTFICVTHDQDEALSMSDEIAIISEGRIVQRGTPDALFERPETHFIADFLGESNFLRGTLVARQQGGFIYTAAGQQFRQAGDPASSAVGDPLLIALRPYKISIHESPPVEAVNRIKGTIGKWSYRGSEIHCLVETPAGALMVTHPTWHAPFVPDVGKSVWLTWPPDAAVVVRDDRAGRYPIT
jgi:putative spermidine/putrescine transport system ATP-binding protein